MLTVAAKSKNGVVLWMYAFHHACLNASNHLIMYDNDDLIRNLRLDWCSMTPLNDLLVVKITLIYNLIH